MLTPEKVYQFKSQWRSSAPKSGGGTHFSPKKVKSKKKKKGQCGVKAQDRVYLDVLLY